MTLDYAKELKKNALAEYDKSDAINDAEFTGNVLLLLREAMNFVKSNTVYHNLD